MTAEPPAPASPDRRELTALVGLVLVALVLRVVHLDHAVVEHFDEGVYVSNLWFGAESDFRYPFRHLYAPPLVPGLVEWSMILFGTGTLGTLLPSLVLGVATVPLVWWAMRVWCGPLAGWAAAILWACSDQHVLFSRTALVDGPLCGFLLAGVFLLSQAFLRNSWRWAVAAGVATGLAWWTKYNGWLPLAIGLAGGWPWAWVRTGDGESRIGVGRLLALWGVAAATAGIVWSPVLWGLQERGGYASVAANHAGYVVGFGGWFAGLRHQLANVNWTGSVLGASGWALLVVPAVLLLKPWSLRTFGLVVAVVVALGGATFVFGAGGPLLVVGVGTTIVWMFRDLRVRDAEADRALGHWLLAAWFYGLLLTTPLYRAYPRLMLPWQLAATLIAAAGFAEFVTFSAARLVERGGQGERSEPRPVGVIVGAAGFGVVGLGLLLVSAAQGTGPPHGDRGGVARVADEIAHVVGDDPRSVVFVHADPALFHHLRRLGVSAVPAGRLASVEQSVLAGARGFLVVGENARRSPGFQEEWQRVGPGFVPRGTWTMTPSRLVALNLFEPEELRTLPDGPSLAITLYEHR